MDDLLKIDMSFPVPRFSCLPCMISFRSQPRGPSSFSVAKKNQNATAAPAAMKVSGLANGVIAAPVNAEER